MTSNLPVKSAAARKRMRRRRGVRRYGDHSRRFHGVSKYQRCGTRAVEATIELGEVFLGPETALVYTTQPDGFEVKLLDGVLHVEAAS